MSNTSKNLIRHPFGKDGRDIFLPVDGGSHIYEGSLVSQLSGTAMLVPGSTASSGNAVGVAVHEIDNTNGSDGDKRCRVEFDRIFEFANGLTTDACSEATQLFSVVYMGDDHTIFDNDAGGTLKAAGRFCGMSEDGKVRVFVGAAIADLGDALADASDVAIADAGNFTSQTTAEGATQEIYQHLESIQKQVNIPITAALEVATGALLTVFADGSTSVPGTQLTNSKAVSVRWNNHATPAAIAVTVPMPQDLDDMADVVFHALVSKVGATSGDATKLTVGAFEQTVAALHDADSDFGGDTTAVVGNATSKTVTEVTLSLLGANVHATPSAMTFTIQPKAGTLGTDDLCLHAAWLEYKGKLLAS
jgi:hypothetical protein